VDRFALTLTNYHNVLRRSPTSSGWYFYTHRTGSRVKSGMFLTYFTHKETQLYLYKINKYMAQIYNIAIVVQQSDNTTDN
jgi:hypothetical protein